MIKPNKTLSILLSMALVGTVVYGQEIKKVLSPEEDLEERLKEINNPFKTRLPIEEEEVEDYSGEQKRLTPEERRKARMEQQGQLPPEVIPAEEEPEPVIEEVVEVEPVEEEPEPIEEFIPLPNILVSGIIWDSNRPQAIIDGKVLDIGDSIQGIEITSIDKDRISGTFHGKPVTVSSQRRVYYEN